MSKTQRIRAQRATSSDWRPEVGDLVAYRLFNGEEPGRVRRLGISQCDVAWESASGKSEHWVPYDMLAPYVAGRKKIERVRVDPDNQGLQKSKRRVYADALSGAGGSRVTEETNHYPKEIQDMAKETKAKRVKAEKIAAKSAKNSKATAAASKSKPKAGAKKRKVTPRDPVASENKSAVFARYKKSGRDSAYALGEKKGINPNTLRSWLSVWGNAGKKKAKAKPGKSKPGKSKPGKSKRVKA